MDIMKLNRLVYFAAVADTGSFTAAAGRLGITKSVVSQQVARLEFELGATLLIRTTRKTELTDAGRTLYGRCSVILRDVEEAFDQVQQSNTEPIGNLRVSAPNDFGTAIVVAVAADFSARHARCRVELFLGDHALDLVSNRIDLAIRVGWLADSSLQARRIGGFRQVAVASAAFARTIVAQRPEDLAHIPFVANTVLDDPLSWRFSRDGEADSTVHMRSTIGIDSTPAVLAAVLAGGGFSILPDFLVRPAIADGRLVTILPEWDLPMGGIHAVYPAARFRPARVTAFAQMLMARLATLDHETPAT